MLYVNQQLNCDFGNSRSSYVLTKIFNTIKCYEKFLLRWEGKVQRFRSNLGKFLTVSSFEVGKNATSNQQPAYPDTQTIISFTVHTAAQQHSSRHRTQGCCALRSALLLLLAASRISGVADTG
jgi:hypothetical protein